MAKTKANKPKPAVAGKKPAVPKTVAEIEALMAAARSVAA